MSSPSQILITGAAGFIGSCLVSGLNSHGLSQLVLADNFAKEGKDRYLQGKSFHEKIASSALFDFLETSENIGFVFHLGGKTSNSSDFESQNVRYPQQLFNYCRLRNIPFVYASSSSTYGAGEHGYVDDEGLIPVLKPLNEYGVSKNDFDQWILNNASGSPYAGLKIFNVFGPNEYHKGQSASVAFKSFFEIREHHEVTLFGSSDPSILPGDQLRDFIYVKDVVKVLVWFWQKWEEALDTKVFPSGIYNVGTGIGRSFNDVARAVLRSMEISETIKYKEIPASIAKNYRTSTVAETHKLRAAGCDFQMYTLEEAIEDLVKNYLIPGKYL